MIRRSSIFGKKQITIDPEAQAYLTAANIVSGATYYSDQRPISGKTIISAVNTLFLSLKANSLYSKFIILYLYLGATSANNRVNALAPGTGDATEGGDEAPLYNFDGMQPNRNLTASTLYSHLVMPKKPNQLPSGDMSIGVYLSKQVSSLFDIGCDDGSFGLGIQAGTNILANNGVVNTPDYSPDLLGLSHLNITSTTTYTYFFRGVKIQSGAASAAHVVNFNMWLGNMNVGDTFPRAFGSRNTQSAAYAAHAFSDTESATLNSILDTYSGTINRALVNRMTFIGDSITNGSDADTQAERFTTLVSSNYSSTENNKGNPGQAIDYFYGNRATLVPVKSVNDKYLILATGTNEVQAGMSTADYKSYGNAFWAYVFTQGWSPADCVYITMFYHIGFVGSEEDRIATAGVDIAATNGITRVINMKPIMAANGGDALINPSNHVHPNSLGHSVIATNLITFLDSF